jgi:hypothetical protein
MNLFVRAVEAVQQQGTSDPLAVGAGPAGRGPQPLQAHGSPEQDAAVLAGTEVYRAVTGNQPARDQRLWLGSAAHYLFGLSAGIGYVLLQERLPGVTAGKGVVYGTLVWLVADEGVTPALGLSRTPGELDAGTHAAALLSHWVYGAALDAACRTGEGR